MIPSDCSIPNATIRVNVSIGLPYALLVHYQIFQDEKFDGLHRKTTFQQIKIVLLYKSDN
jgi:hypothetical protein